MQKYIPFFQIALTALIARILGWCGAALASADITLSWKAGAPEHIAGIITGLGLMGIHWFISHVNLKVAHGASDVKPLPAGVSRVLAIGALIGVSLFGGTGCATSGTGAAPSSISTAVSSGTTTTSTTTAGPTAMQKWVTANPKIFYYLGYGGAEAYVTFGVQHGTTKVQLAQDVIIAHGAINALDTNQPLSADAIQSDITKAGGSVGNKSVIYSNLGSTLSGPIGSAVQLCGGDVLATLDALNDLSQGMADYAQTLLPSARLLPREPWEFAMPLDARAARIERSRFAMFRRSTARGRKNPRLQPSSFPGAVTATTDEFVFLDFGPIGQVRLPRNSKPTAYAKSQAVTLHVSIVANAEPSPAAAQEKV